ncbi:MAG: Uma2 family endonuclease, partial [Isosphaeraceae bacterium]
MATGISLRLAQLAPEAAAWTPEWEAAQVFPVRIACSEEEYLALDENRFLEYSDGFLEILPMPTIFHQLILKYLCWELDCSVKARRLGTVVPAPYKVRIRPGKHREPDILFISFEHSAVIGEDFCTRADLVMEVVSANNRRHDLVTKRDEYAQAGILEYWIVDPEEATITVFVLRPRRKTYVEHGRFAKGQRATSQVLPGFEVDVTVAL